MTAARRANSGGSADAVSVTEGVARELLPVAVFPVAPLKVGWLGSAGITDAIGATNSTASSTTAVYYTVPTGKVARIHKFIIGIYDNTAGSMTTLGGRSVADESGVDVEVVNVDTSTAQTLIGDGNLNFKLLARAGNTPGALVVSGSTTALSVSWIFAVPLTLTAGQKLRVTPRSSVAYQIGLWGIEYTEETA